MTRIETVLLVRLRLAQNVSQARHSDDMLKGRLGIGRPPTIRDRARQGDAKMEATDL